MLANAKHPRAIIALCVLTVIAIAALAVFESSGGFVTASGDPTTEIESAYSVHLSDIHSMNVTAIEQGYASGASVEFVDQNQDTGNLTGLSSIGKAWGANLFPNFAVPNFTHVDPIVKVSGSKATLDSKFVIEGYDSDADPLTANVSAHVAYVRQGSGWVISFESWDITFPINSTDSGD